MKSSPRAFSSLGDRHLTEPTNTRRVAVTEPIGAGTPGGGVNALFGGGTDGNEQLTSIAGALLLVLFAVLGVTIIRIGQLMWLHLFLGLLLIGPVALKLASTGYRFVRYYSTSPAYRRKGPPHPALRGLAPLVVASSLAVFATGVLLLVDGPGSRDRFLIWHKVSFFIWIAAMAPHVLGHLAELARSLAPGRRTDTLQSASAGRAGRTLALVSALVAGLVLAIVLLPDFAAWTSGGAHLHHHG
jgi:hypothetical protein